MCMWYVYLCSWYVYICVSGCAYVYVCSMVCIEAEDIKKRWQEHTEGLHKTDLNDPDNHNGVITQLEADILE